ncbi:MAG: PDZ domain-containing protein [Acidobacteria bacterium]|nr:PDZ domain-containing protein [Acidobacteriota bacterium]MDA1236011.1 PDZ domain-containing protein [Acidobacteriota bacterium]
MTLQSCITQATFSLALAATPFTLHTVAQGAPPQAAISSQSWLGVGIIDLAPEKARQLNLGETHGVEIAQVAQGGPAEEAGLQRGDVITRFRGEQVLGAEHLARLVRETPGGRTVPLEVWRDGRQRGVDVVVQSRGLPTTVDIAEQFKRKAAGVGFDFPRAVTVVRNRSLGMEMEVIQDQFANYFGVKQGVLLRSVEAGSPAAKAGLVAGDVIVSIADSVVQDPADIRRELHRSDASVEIGIVRNRRTVKRTLAKEESTGGSWPLAGHN